MAKFAQTVLIVVCLFSSRYPTTSFHFNQVWQLEKSFTSSSALQTLSSVHLQERIFNLYDTDQEELPVTSPVLMRLRKSGVQANARPDKRTTLFVAD